MKENKYLEDKLALVRAGIFGSLAGLQMAQEEGKMIQDVLLLTDRMMAILEKDIRQLYKYAYKQGKLKTN